VPRLQATEATSCKAVRRQVGPSAAAAPHVGRVPKEKQANATTAEFPFLIFHDPEDGITAFDCSKRLQEKAPSKDKRLIAMPGGRHDLIANEPSKIVEHFTAFMLARLTSRW
jgi:alpha-beta hydrolase superfamily lysophospholipase